MKETIANQVVDYLERREVEHIFGLCGHTVITMLDSLKDSSIEYISVRHEQIASHAADGYTRVSGKPGVVLCHLGPGLTNALTGVANASLDSKPMVIIAGDVPSYYYGKHPHQEINLHSDASQHEIYDPVVKRSWRVDKAESFPDILDRAFRLAVSGRPGPVLISVPMDIFSRKIERKHFERTFHDEIEPSRPSLEKKTARKIAQKLIEAENPVIHVGGGVVDADASEELQELAEFLNIPVTRTLMGQGAISDKHPLHAGMTGFWGVELTNGLTREADVILALGTKFGEADSSSWYEDVTFNIPPTELLQIDIDPNEIGRNYPVKIGAVADAKQALKEINEQAKNIKPDGQERPEVIERIEEYWNNFREENKEYTESDNFPMTPQRILKEVREALPEDGVVATDVGWNKNGVGQQFEVTQPNTILHPSGLATMGFGPAAVIGAKLAAPNKKVITLVGDGGFGANPSVISTAVEENIPVVWVVMNNYAFGTIAGLQEEHYNHQYGTIFRNDEGDKYNPDWADIAEAYGAKGQKIASANEFLPVFKEALAAEEPFLIDVPMVNEPVPTEGSWNINDIYTQKDNVKEGRLKKE